MPRKKRLLDRDSGVVRDASLLVIASEDKYAVKDYFSHFRTKKVQIIVAPTDDGNSAPNHVRDRLDQFVREHQIEPGDSLWLCIDRDKWTPAVLNQVCSHCHNHGYKVAISNPCFELWILLHFEDIGSQTFDDCKQVDERLRVLLGGYTKQSCARLSLTQSMVEAAIVRAKQQDSGSSPVLDQVGSRVYRIIEELRHRDAIAFL